MSTEETLNFKNIWDDVLMLPNSWIKNTITQGDKNFVIFSTMTFKDTNDKLYGILLKEVIVDENLKIQINILGKSIDAQEHNIGSVVNSIEMLQNIIFDIHSMKICQGCLLPEDLRSMQCNVIETDCTNIVRHKKCSLLSINTQCTFCTAVKRTLIRRKQRINTNIVKKQSIFSQQKKDKVKKLKNKVQRVKKQKQRFKTKNAILTQNIKTRLKIMSTMSFDEVLQKMKDKGIPKNQYNAVKEIIKASKCKRREGIRYSEDWMLLCILLYMRSSAGYNFLKNNYILPLPCIGTIRRYLSF